MKIILSFENIPLTLVWNFIFESELFHHVILMYGAWVFLGFLGRGVIVSSETLMAITKFERIIAFSYGLILILWKYIFIPWMKAQRVNQLFIYRFPLINVIFQYLFASMSLLLFLMELSLDFCLNILKFNEKEVPRRFKVPFA